MDSLAALTHAERRGGERERYESATLGSARVLEEEGGREGHRKLITLQGVALEESGGDERGGGRQVHAGLPGWAGEESRGERPGAQDDAGGRGLPAHRHPAHPRAHEQGCKRALRVQPGERQLFDRGDQVRLRRGAAGVLRQQAGAGGEVAEVGGTTWEETR